MKKNDYVHGYSQREASRLHDQASTLESLLHNDTIYKAGSLVLEAGCGAGAQTEILCVNNPDSDFVSIDISNDSLVKAQEKVDAKGIKNVRLQCGNIFDLDFPDNYFDHLFICFVLEHLVNPLLALEKLKRVLKTGGTVTVIEGDHGSVMFYPESSFAKKTVDALIRIQEVNGGDALIGRKLYPLLIQGGFKKVSVQPRMVYADANSPDIVDGFIRKTFNPMIEGVKEDALRMSLIDKDEWETGVKDLYRTAEPHGVFCYTFFKGIGYK